MRARSWALGILAGAVVLVIGADVGRGQAPGAAAKPAAVVNGETISLADVDAAVRVMNGPSAVQIPDGKRRQLRLEALGLLMDNLLLQQFLRANAPRIDPSDITKHIAELETALKKDNKKLSDYLTENGMTDAQLRVQVINGLQWRDFTKARISDADVAQYYKENKDFFDGVQVRASHILLRVPTNAGESEAKSARAKLLSIRQDIEASKITFADAAKKYSQCPSASEGGDLGYFPRKFFIDEEFAKAAFNPQLHVGDLIGLVRTEFGLHLIKLTDRKPGKESDFNKIKDDVREVCLTELRMNIVTHERKNAKIDVSMP
jgi:parvulin-like peptidyl-prolyl isomerase